MSPRRKRRLIMAICVLCGASTAATLTAAAFKQNILFFYTPTQIITGTINPTQTFRLGGLVAANSVKRTPGKLDMRFIITDNTHQITVVYSGVLPDLFRQGKGVVVRGKLQNGIVQAEEVLAKHDENYAPPDLSPAAAAESPY